MRSYSPLADDGGATGRRTAFQRFVRLLQQHQRLLVQSVFATAVVTVLGFGTALYIQVLVDVVLVDRDLRVLHLLSGAMLLLVLFRSVFTGLRSYLLIHVGLAVRDELVGSFCRHVIRLPMAFFDSRQDGEVLSRLHDIRRIRDLLTGATASIIIDGMTVMAVTVVVLWYDAMFAVIAISAAFLFGVVGFAFRTPLREAQHKVMSTSGALFGTLVEAVQGVATVKSFAAERAMVSRADNALTPFLAASFSARRLGMVATVIASALAGVATLAVLWFGAGRVVAGELTVGQLIAAHTLVGYMIGPLQRVISANRSLQDGFAALVRLGEVLEETIEVQEGPLQPPVQCSGRVSFRDVTFAYDETNVVLDRVTFSIESNELLAIVGHNGSGKSTIARLMQRLYQPQGGQITLDGVDVRLLSPIELRRRIAVVSQETRLFTGTVADNIIFGCERDAPLDAVIRAARLAGAHGFIQDLPRSYDTELGERGIQLSSGQRQRIVIARLLIRDPSVIVLDEATSMLDAEAEQSVLRTMLGLRQRKAIVIISHRLYSLVDADRILVLHAGRIVQEGTHARLFESSGEYRKLWERQHAVL